jgi:hypothetical protein
MKAATVQRKPQSKPFVWFCTPLMKGRDMVTFVRTAKENLKGGDTR